MIIRAWEALPLGVETDGTIARRLGVSRQLVQRARKRLGIPAARAYGPLPERMAVRLGFPRGTLVRILVVRRVGESLPAVLRRLVLAGLEKD